MHSYVLKLFAFASALATVQAIPLSDLTSGNKAIGRRNDAPHFVKATSMIQTRDNPQPLYPTYNIFTTPTVSSDPKVGVNSTISPLSLTFDAFQNPPQISTLYANDLLGLVIDHLAATRNITEIVPYYGHLQLGYDYPDGSSWAFQLDNFVSHSPDYTFGVAKQAIEGWRAWMRQGYNGNGGKGRLHPDPFGIGPVTVRKDGSEIGFMRVVKTK